MSQIDIRDVAARYLGYRSHTGMELFRHLKQKGFAEEAAAEVVAEFTEYGYIDDSRYCRQYFDYAFGKGKGKRLVFAELKEKGVAEDVIRFAFEDWQEEADTAYDEKNQAMAEARKVLRMAGVDFDEEGEVAEDCNVEIDEKLLAKVGRRLHGKGYSSDVIYKVIGVLRR